MTKTQLVCDKTQLNWGLKAAKAIAGKSPYDIIQMRVSQDRDYLYVCAVNDKATLVAKVELLVANVSGEEDEIITIDKAKVPALILATAETGKKSEDSRPMAGICIRGKEVDFTDENGAGRGVDLTTIHRNDSAEIGDPVRTIIRVKQQLAETSPCDVTPSPAQITELARATRYLGGKPKLSMRSYMHEGTESHRLVAEATFWTLSVLNVPEALLETEKDKANIVDAAPIGGIS
ncbi:hypothetical protein CHUV2995_00208 [Corynebacterium diphtheriae subsp. lausannense]|nr:hypothetical protein CHUV2995_00208 [Corynebacterium diphtheriae subsp. lausannense]